MKYIISVLCLFLTACFDSQLTQVDINKLKFTAGDLVKTSVTFYSNCEGTIVGYFPYYYKSTNEYNYEVELYCPNSGWINKIILPGSSLKLIRKEK